MEIISSVSEMQRKSLQYKTQGKTIGFVPTMGYLHQGHLYLLERIRDKCDLLITSIFVNPMQFGAGEDFETYPRDITGDEKLLREAECDIIFYPPKEDMYPPGYSTYVNVEGLTDHLCGKSRPGHFRGVASIVAKLFIITQCDIACFGQKDGQQAAVVRRMAADLNLPIEIVIAPIVREADGLAMSSRNVYLSSDDRQNALCLKKSLDMAENMVREGKRNTKIILRNMRKFIELVEGVKLDYIEAVDPQDMQPKSRIEGPTMFAIAAYVGKTRLIDNVILQ